MKISTGIKLVSILLIGLLCSVVYAEDRIPNLPKLDVSSGIVCESPRTCLGRSMVVMNLLVNNRVTKSASCLMEELRRGFINITCSNASISARKRVKATERSGRRAFLRVIAIPANNTNKHYMIKLLTMGKYISVSTFRNQGRLYWNIRQGGGNTGRWKECSSTAFFTAERGCMNAPRIIRPPQKPKPDRNVLFPRRP